MKKYVGYIPAVVFTSYYLLKTAFGASLTWPIILVWLVCFWLSALLIHKGLLLGGVLGLFPGVHMTFVREMYRGILLPGIKIPLGIVVLLFYIVTIFYLWKTKGANPRKVENREVGILFVKMVLTVAAFMLSAYIAVVLWSFLITLEILPGFAYISTLVPISFLLPMIWIRNRKKFMIRWLVVVVVFAIFLVLCFSSKADFSRLKYKDSTNSDEWFVYVNDEEYAVKQADARVKVSLRASEKSREMELVLPFVYSSYGEWEVPDEFLTELTVKYEWVEPAKQGGASPLGVNEPLQRLHIISEKEKGEFCVQQPTECGSAIIWIEYVFE